MPWTLEHASTTQSLAAWGLSNVTLTHQALTAGRMTAQLPGNMLATLPFAWKDAVILRDPDSVVRFRGVAMSPTRSFAGPEEIITIEFADPWWWLTQGVYAQDAYDAGSATAKATARAAMFADMTPGTSWTAQDAAWQIEEIITACNAYHGGGKLQFGSLSGSFAINPPPVEVSSATWEQALRAVLNWVPDAVQSWDYTTTPPTLSFVRRGSASSVTRALAVGSGADFTPRDEDVVRGVQLAWIRKTEDGTQQIAADNAGETSGTGILRAAFTLDTPDPATVVPGVSETQFVRSISTDDALDVEGDRPNPAEEWFFQHGGFSKIVADVADMVVLHPANAASVTGLTGGPYLGLAPDLILDPDAEENDGYTGLNGNDRWLVEGDIPKWLTRSNHYRIGLLKAEILTRVLPPGQARYVYEVHKVSRRIPLTDLGSSAGTIYTHVITEDTVVGGPQEIFAVAPGLAALILAARNTLHYAGRMTVTGEECDFDLSLSKVLNVTGGLSAWETMAAQIQAVTHALETGATTVQVGPPEHLSVQDFVTALQSVSRAQIATWIQQAAGGAEA